MGQKPGKITHRVALVTFIAIHFALLLGIFVTATLQGYKLKNKYTEFYAEQTLQTLIQQHAGISKDTEETLAKWANSIEADDLSPENACESETIKTLTDNKNRYTVYGTVTPDGYIACANINYPENANVADRKYIQKVLETKEPAIGEYQVGAISGKPSINLGYPVLDEHGNVQTILVIGLSLNWANDLMKSMNLPEGAEVLITDRNGTILAKYPEGDLSVGTSRFDPETFSVILARRAGSLDKTAEDGVKKIYKFSPFFTEDPETPHSFILVGFPKTLLSGPLNVLTRNTIILIILVTGFEGILAKYLLFRKKKA